MTERELDEGELTDVLTRAAEAGHLDGEVVDWLFKAPSGSRAEAEAFVRLYAKIHDLVGRFPILETTVRTVDSNPAIQLQVSAVRWADHLRHTRYPELVPDELLLDFDEAKADHVRLCEERSIQRSDRRRYP